MQRGESVDTTILVKRAKQGDQDALVKLVMAQKQEYFKLAYVYMKDKEDSMDAMEDMILILYENIHKLKKDDSFYSWSKTILVNCCRGLLRKKKKIISLDYIKEETYDGDFEHENQKLMIERYLSQLNEKQQEVIRLRYFLDLDYETISNIIKLPIGTVKSRISIGLKKLKENFGGEYCE
jgi:RNA polymerase sigma factor (sigma-70 family)